MSWSDESHVMDLHGGVTRDTSTHLPESRGCVPTQHLPRRRHLLLAHEVPLVVPLVALPGQPALEEEEQGVCEGFQVVAAAGGTSKVRMDTGISHGSPARYKHKTFH